MQNQTTLGLRENWQQFSLLVMINAFVGGMVGLERSIIPEIAQTEFGVAATSAIFSFILVFGIVKATANHFAGFLANKIGRKKLLLFGWLFAIPIPFILMFAPNWEWIIIANIFLGINQGLAWSSTVIMKIDLVGEKNRGLAMGLNEFAGYISVALVALITAWIADTYGLRPYPFFLGIVLSLGGLGCTWFFVKDTEKHVEVETGSSNLPFLKNIFWETTWKNKNLGSVTQAGLINNLNDGMIWGLFPILLSLKGYDLKSIGTIVSVYPAVWGVGQLFTGKLADKANKKWMLFLGMVVQGIAILGMTQVSEFIYFVLLSIMLGLGTAVVYPTFLATIADFTHPKQRAQSIGIFRFWRDLGYAVGALLTGILSDLLGINAALYFVGGLTIFSGFILGMRMRKTIFPSASVIEPII